MPGQGKIYVTKDCFLQGEINFCKSINIEGCFEGNKIEATEVYVGKTGRLKITKIKTESIVVEGIVLGDIEASCRVILMPTAKVAGKITTPELIIQKGVIFAGSCSIKSDLNENIDPYQKIVSLYETREK